jgi:effector-binding domain-containing protein
MKILKWFLLLIGALVVLVLVVPLFLPDQVHVESTVKIDEKPEKIFHSVALFQQRDEWDPWLSSDTTAIAEITPVENYVGSTYEWEGEESGSGKMQVDSVDYGKHVTAKIWFAGQPEPSTVIWDFEKQGDSTVVSWGFIVEGNYPIGKLFINLMKGSMKEQFNKGLTNLKEKIESGENYISSTSEIVEAESPQITAMVAKTAGTMDQVTAEIEQMFTDVMAEINSQGLQMAGPPFCYYTDYNPEDMSTTTYCGVPVVSAGEATEKVMVKSFESMPAIKLTHMGPYDEFNRSYSILMNYVEENNLPVNYNAWEVYINDPMQVEYPSLYKTDIYFELEN